jgi:hypothetical protein
MVKFILVFLILTFIYQKIGNYKIKDNCIVDAYRTLLVFYVH